jgi:O-methyltransferase involved in polyketide biosynthesis
MADKHKIKLTAEQETLLITLFSRAQDNRRPDPFLLDPYAAQILQRVEYDFEALKVPHGTQLTLVIRARQFDIYARDFITRYPDAVILHLGCGLDSRFLRLKDSGLNLTGVQWYDLDLPAVIALRREFYAEEPNYHMLPSPAQDLSWTDSVETRTRPTLMLAEGLSMYLKAAENRALLLHLKECFANCEVVFDAYSTLTARNANRHPSVRRTGATLEWGIDDPLEIESWTDGITFVESWHFDQSDIFPRLSFGDRLMFRVTGLFPFVRRAHRILVYRL